MAAGSLGIPAINNISGLGAVFVRRGLLRQLVERLYRFALRRSVTVFFQNRDDLQLFVDRRIVTPAQAKLLPGSGVDLAHFTPAPLPAEGAVTFLLAARLLWDKGVGEFVEAARRLRRDFPDARFRILGNVERKSAAAVPLSKLQEWSGEGVIDYLGSADDVRPALAAADCIVLPSYYREGVPRVLLEAAAMGIPVITTDMPGCREAVEDGATGLLCEPRSVNSLVAEDGTDDAHEFGGARCDGVGRQGEDGERVPRGDRSPRVSRRFGKAWASHELRARCSCSRAKIQSGRQGRGTTAPMSSGTCTAVSIYSTLCSTRSTAISSSAAREKRCWCSSAT